MKKYLFAMLLQVLCQGAFAWTFSEIKGSYRVKPEYVPFPVTVTVSESGNLLIESKNFGKHISCKGKAALVKDVISAALPCTDGSELQIKINIAHVKDASKFKAPVYTSILGEVTMSFKKLN